MRGGRLDVGAVAETLRANLGIDRDSAEKKVFQFVVLEIGRRIARSLLEHQHAEPRLGQFARHDAARGARPDHHEIHGLLRTESARRHTPFSEYGTKPAYSRS